MSARRAPALALTLLAFSCTKPNPLFLGEASEGASGSGGSGDATTTGTSSPPDTTTLDPSGAAGTDGATSTSTTTTSTTTDATTSSSGSTGAPVVCPVSGMSLGVQLLEGVLEHAKFGCDAPTAFDRFVQVKSVNGATMALQNCQGCPCQLPDGELKLALDFAAKDTYLDVFTPGDCLHIVTEGVYDPGLGDNVCVVSALAIFDDNKDKDTAPPRVLISRTGGLSSSYPGKLTLTVDDAGPACDSSIDCTSLQGDHSLTFAFESDGVETVSMGLLPGFSLTDVMLDGPSGLSIFDVYVVRAQIDETCVASSEWALRRTK